VTLAAAVGCRPAASSGDVEPKDGATAAETRVTTPQGADDATLPLEGGEDFHDALDRKSRPLSDAVGAESICPDGARDGIASRRLVTRIGHGRSRRRMTSTRAGAPVEDVAYARSWWERDVGHRTTLRLAQVRKCRRDSG
jgi:hypothetical protein